MGLASTHANDPAALKVIFSSILLICKIFYSLNFQVWKCQLFKIKKKSKKTQWFLVA